MPVFTIRDSQTGRTLQVRGDSPPTEEEMTELFTSTAQEQPKRSPFVPELVAGTPEKMAQQRARNLQGEMGLTEAVAPSGTVPASARMKASFAPTKEEQQAFYESEYGKGSFIPITDTTALVRVPDGKGNHHWVPDNPYGLDARDVLGAVGRTPEAISGIAAGVAAVPGAAGAIGKIAVSSGASAVAANAVGAVQDVAFRYFTGQPINGREILQRRGIGAGLEAGAGIALPVAGGKVVQTMRSGGAARGFVKQFIEEGERARKRLGDAGFTSRSAAQLADEIRLANPARISADDAGNTIASALTDADRALRGSSENLLKQAAKNLANRSQAELAAIAAPPVTPVQAGMAAIGGIKKTVESSKKAVDDMYQAAYEEINRAGQAAGMGEFVITLPRTHSLIDQLQKLPLRTMDGSPSDIYAPLLATVKKLEGTTGITQKLEAVRNLRSMVGEAIGKEAELFPGLRSGQLEQLYKALSDDIDTSVASLTIPGSQQLRVANAAYKQMVQPFEASAFLQKAANDARNGGFESPEELVGFLARGRSEDWKMAKQFIAPNTFNRVRRAVIDDLIGGARVNVAGRDVADISRLGTRLSALSPEAKKDIFGSPAVWQSLEKKGRELAYLKAKEGIFTSQALPPLDALNEAILVAKTEGFDKANGILVAALKEAGKRRENMASSLIAQIKNGNLVYVSENPGQLFESVILSGQYSTAQVTGILNRLPLRDRRAIGEVAFQQLWEKAKDFSESAVSGAANRYSHETMLKNVFGGAGQKETMQRVLGERFGLIEDWTAYMMKLAIANSKRGQEQSRLAGLIAVAPYHSLFGARAASYALSKASGQAFLHHANPQAATLFAETRAIMKAPKKTAAQIALVQRALNMAGYGDYQDMMQDLSPEQQDAIDAYLSIQR